jgi:hypothetical protein
MLGVERSFQTVLREKRLPVFRARIANLLGYKILNQESTHGKHKETKQGRTQKIETHRAQESEGGKAAEAAGICPWLEEAQSEEDGARRGEAVKGSTWHLALGPRAKC